MESSVVDAGEVASTTGLVFFGFEAERVHIYTYSGHVGVVLVGLYQVEVAAFTFVKPVVAVKFDESGDNGVVAGLAFGEGAAVARVEYGAVPPVGVVEWLLTFPFVDNGVVTADEGVALYNPYEFLDGVVEVKADLVAAAGDAFVSGELELFDEVFVGKLSHTTAFLGVKVDVVYPERGGYETGVAYTGAYNVVGGAVPAQVAELFEVELKAHFVVLKGDKRKGKARVAAEPELERDVHGVLRGAFAGFAAGVGFATGAVVVASYTRVGKEVGEFRYVTDHLGISGLLTSGLGKFVPDVEPVAILFVDLLATDFEFDVLDEAVSHPVEPAEFGTRTIAFLEFYLRESYLEVYSVDKVTVTADSAAYLAAEVGVTVEGLFDGFHREVSVSTVDYLEEGNLRIRRQVDILSTISYKLH